MRVLAAVLLAVAAPSLGAPGRVYVTELGRRVLTRADEVVEARVARVQPAFRGITTARLDVVERLAGFGRDPSLVLMYVEDFIAPDALTSTLETATLRQERERRAGLERLGGAGAPAAAVERSRQDVPAGGAGPAGIRLAEGEEGLFFLTRRGASFALVGLVPKRDPLYDAKRSRLREVLRIEAIQGLEPRVLHAKTYFLRGLQSVDAWERGNSAREILGLASRFPGMFEAEEGVRLARLLFDEPDPVIQSALERAVRVIDPEKAQAFAVAAEAREREQVAEALAAEREKLAGTKSPELLAADLANLGRRYRRAATEVLVEHLAHPDALVRETAAQALAEYGGPSCRAGLRLALEKERDPDVARALLYACGVKADPEAVPVVAKRLPDPELERTAVHALARIGNEAAREVLGAHRARADEETARLIGQLLEEEFARKP
jgi:hypothetical protein